MKLTIIGDQLVDPGLYDVKQISIPKAVRLIS
jgi:hypothetical protein